MTTKLPLQPPTQESSSTWSTPQMLILNSESADNSPTLGFDGAGDVPMGS